jgi:hypothetical protein
MRQGISFALGHGVKFSHQTHAAWLGCVEKKILSQII